MAREESAMTTADLRAWQACMGYTYDTAAKALGVSRAAYADWIAGRSRTTGKPIKISRLVALACAALAAGVGEWAAAASVSKSHASPPKENRP